jgi:hypothetical protein
MIKGGDQLTPQDGRLAGAWARTEMANAPTAIMVEDFILIDFGTKGACLLA